VDSRLLAAAYDRSAGGYDQRFRELQRPKFRAVAPWLVAPAGSPCVDAGGGTALLLEWASEEQPQLLRGRWLVLDLSIGMLRIARSRSPLLVAADLARPPLRPASCALVCAFTSVLDEAPRALRELAALVAPGGHLAVSFLKAEAPRELPTLRLVKDVEAGQDRIFVLRKD
jgi:SAM-dependent methyltransferase